MSKKEIIASSSSYLLKNRFRTLKYILKLLNPPIAHISIQKVIIFSIQNIYKKNIIIRLGT